MCIVTSILLPLVPLLKLTLDGFLTHILNSKLTKNNFSHKSKSITVYQLCTIVADVTQITLFCRLIKVDMF